MTFLPLFVTIALMSPFRCQASSEFIFTKVDVLENNKYIKSNFKIENIAGQSMLSADFTVLQEFNYRILVRMESYMLPMTMTPVRKAPKVNYCSLFGANANIVDYKHAFAELIKSNNTPLPCPIKPGSYQMNKFRMIVKSIPSFEILVRNNTQLYTQITLIDANGKKPVQIFSYKVFVMYVKY